MLIAAATLAGSVLLYSNSTDMDMGPEKLIMKIQKEDAGHAVKKWLVRCRTSLLPRACLRSAARELLRSYAYEEVLAGFSALGLTDNPVYYPECHEALYYIGALEYQRSKSISGVYARSHGACYYASYHGTLQGYFSAVVGSKEAYHDNELIVAMQGACGNPGDYTTRLAYDQCFHGIGHAVMVLTDGDLMRSLRLCEVLKKENNTDTCTAAMLSDEADMCYSGAFMESLFSATHEHYSRRNSNQESRDLPCENFPAQYQTRCYAALPGKFYLDSNYDQHETIARCSEIPPQYQERCFGEAGAFQVFYLDDVEAMRYCQVPTNPTYRSTCIRIASQMLVIRYEGKTEKAAKYCMDNIEPINQQTCFHEIGRILAAIDPEKAARQTPCRTLMHPTYTAWCEQGLRDGITQFATR